MNTGKITWAGPHRLADYRSSQKGPGIYAIGTPRDPAKTVTASSERDPYVFNWPDNLKPVYVGISESRGEGVRRRLRSHFRGKGNKMIRDMMLAGDDLWFVFCSGADVVNYEALFLIAFTPQTGFVANRRSETRNFAARLHREIDRDLQSKGLDPNYRPWESDPDYFVDG